MPWVGPLDYAKHHGIPLYSDDAALRAVARGEGVAAFGTLALLEALVEQGATIDLTGLYLSLRRACIVDLPFNAVHVRQLAEEIRWTTPSPASLSLTRPAFWEARQPALDLFTEILKKAAEAVPQSVPGWLYAGLVGACRGTSDVPGLLRAATLLIRAVGATNADPRAFVSLVEAAQEAAHLIAMPDPVDAALRWLFERVKDDHDAQTAATYVAQLTAELEGEPRETARRIVFGVNPPGQ